MEIYDDTQIYPTNVIKTINKIQSAHDVPLHVIHFVSDRNECDGAYAPIR